MIELVNYKGSCHCGRIEFTLKTEPIKEGTRCNCSICRKRNAIMSRSYYGPEIFKLTSGSKSLEIYNFPPHKVHHYFCKHCGIYPFHDAVEDPGIYKINLGCIDEIDLESLKVRVFDGLKTWTYLD